MHKCVYIFWVFMYIYSVWWSKDCMPILGLHCTYIKTKRFLRTYDIHPGFIFLQIEWIMVVDSSQNWLPTASAEIQILQSFEINSLPSVNILKSICQCITGITLLARPLLTRTKFNLNMETGFSGAHVFPPRISKIHLYLKKHII